MIDITTMTAADVILSNEYASKADAILKQLRDERRHEITHCLGRRIKSNPIDGLMFDMLNGADFARLYMAVITKQNEKKYTFRERWYIKKVGFYIYSLVVNDNKK